MPRDNAIFVARHLADDRYARLNDRLYRAQGALLIVFPLLLAVQAVLFRSSFYVIAVHALCFAIAAGVVRMIGPRDAALAFIIIHPFWFFSFALYFYAFVSVSRCISTHLPMANRPRLIFMRRCCRHRWNLSRCWRRWSAMVWSAGCPGWAVCRQRVRP